MITLVKVSLLSLAVLGVRSAEDGVFLFPELEPAFQRVLPHVWHDPLRRFLHGARRSRLDLLL